MMLLARLLDKLIKTGDLTLIDAAGHTHRFGVPGQRPKAAFRLHDRALHRKLAFNPDLYLGEAYMDGTLTVEEGTLTELMALLTSNLAVAPPLPLEPWRDRLAPLLRRLQQFNPIGRARENV